MLIFIIYDKCLKFVFFQYAISLEYLIVCVKQQIDNYLLRFIPLSCQIVTALLKRIFKKEIFSRNI